MTERRWRRAARAIRQQPRSTRSLSLGGLQSERTSGTNRGRRCRFPLTDYLNNHERVAPRPQEKRARAGFGDWHPSSAVRSFCVSKTSACRVFSILWNSQTPDAAGPCAFRRRVRAAQTRCGSRDRAAVQHHGQLPATASGQRRRGANRLRRNKFSQRRVYGRCLRHIVVESVSLVLSEMISVTEAACLTL